jgi:hypothetical protein
MTTGTGKFFPRAGINSAKALGEELENRKAKNKK